MNETKSIRGPIPSGNIINGAQTYFIIERPQPALQIERRVTINLVNSQIKSASCTCTPKASLDNQCSHLIRVLGFRNNVSKNQLSKKQIDFPNQKIKETNQWEISRRDSRNKKANNDLPQIPPIINDISQFEYVIKAVQDEILAIQSSEKTKQYSISNGRLIGCLGERFLYYFEFSDEMNSPPDTPIELVIGKTNIVMGVIVRCESEKNIELVVEQFLGENVSEAKLISRLDFIWKAVDKRLTEMVEKKEFGLLSSFLRPSNETTYEDLTLGNNWGNSCSPDYQQKAAILNCLRQKISFVYGPPGTGKSVTIGWVTKEFIRRGEKTLIISHTNVALDNALEKICSQEEAKDLQKKGEIVRLGQPINPSLNCLRLHEIIELRSKGIIEEQFKTNKLLEKSLENLNTLQEEISLLENYKSFIDEREKLQSDFGILENEIKKILQNAEKRRQELSLLEVKIKSRNIFDILMRNNHKSEIEKVRLIQYRLKNHMMALNEKQNLLNKEFEKNRLRIEKTNLTLDHEGVLNEFRGLQVKKTQIEQEIKYLEISMENLHTKLDEIAKEIFSQVKIIGVTLSKLALDPGIVKFSPDNLIIDELSTAPFPMVLVAMALPRKRAMLFGDPRQLPPISLSTTQNAKYFLQRDTYEIIPDHINVTSKLTVQRRMPESIVKFVNELIYNGNLETDINTEICRSKTKENSPFKNSPFNDHQVIFIDTSTINPWCANDSNKSRYNLFSAHIISELIAKEIGSIQELEKDTLGIICPYRAQKQLIKKFLQSRLNIQSLPESIDVHTVDAFQGEQRKVIILDLTSGQPLDPGIRLSERRESEFSDSPKKGISKVRRLLNVAITRTQYQLVIIANKKYFERELGKERNSKSEYVLEIIHQAEGKSAETRNTHVWIDGENILGGKEESRDGYSAFLNEVEFFQKVKDDFSHATNSIIIISPFVTQNRVRDLQPYILDMLKRRVKIWIVTRPSDEVDFGIQALNQLKSFGCNIIQRSRTHEKVVIIDNSIAYYGSLNLLSHKDSKEVMHRIHGDQVGQILNQFINIVNDNSWKRQITITNKDSLTKEECIGKLKHLRWKIASQRHIPQYAILYNQTLEDLLNNPPETEEALYDFLHEVGEKQMQHLSPFLEEIIGYIKRVKL